MVEVCGMGFGQNMDVHVTWSMNLLVLHVCVSKYLCFKTKIPQKIFSSYQSNLAIYVRICLQLKPTKPQIVSNEPFLVVMLFLLQTESILRRQRSSK